MNQEKYLRVFLESAIIPLDNNDAERSIKKFCVGKHSWHIIDPKKGAKASAILYSIAETELTMPSDFRWHSFLVTRTVIEIEKCKSNPKFETVALISKEMDISLDGIVFHDRAPQAVAKCVVDYFAGKSEAESQRYIDLCMSADKLK